MGGGIQILTSTIGSLRGDGELRDEASQYGACALLDDNHVSADECPPPRHSSLDTRLDKESTAMAEKSACACSAAPKLIFPCSGAADVGAIADQAARQLTRDGKGKMFCLAGVGGRVPGIMKSTEAAAKILAIDGCPLSCAKNCLEKAGFATFEYIQLADMGLEKGKSPVSSEAIGKVAAVGAAKLA